MVAPHFPRSSNWRLAKPSDMGELGMPGNIKCEPGCECKKHLPAAGRSACPDRCTCKRHSRAKREVPVEEKRARDRANARRSRAEDREPSREAARKWAAKNPDYRLRYKFDMTQEQWDEMFEAQGGMCYLCDEFLDTEGLRKIHVDHDRACCRGDRSCGTCVRGLACFNCNVGIAKFGENPERLRRVADNLEMANRRVRGNSGAASASESDSTAAVTPRR